MSYQDVPPDPKILQLIENVKQHQELYNPVCSREVTRSEKQYMWDMIATRSRYAKTEGARNIWRSLVVGLKQHLENVSKKAIRRYIPLTDNPEDKYVQLSDWRYYEYMKFMEPYMMLASLNPTINATCVSERQCKNADEQHAVTIVPITKSATADVTKKRVSTATTSLQGATTPIPIFPAATTKTTTRPITKIVTTRKNVNTAGRPVKIKIGNVIVEIQAQDNADGTAEVKEFIIKPKLGNVTASAIDNNIITKAATSSTIKIINSTSNSTSIGTTPTTATTATIATQKNCNSTQSHINLKAFFDTMLRSTQCLPKFHQERVKRKLLNVIHCQKVDRPKKLSNRTKNN